MKTNRGFTLIELLVTLAIVSVLATIAVPTYVSSVQRASTVEAQAGLNRFRINMEKLYQDNHNYSDGYPCDPDPKATLAPLPTANNFVFTCVITHYGYGYTIAAFGKGMMEGLVYTLSHSENSPIVITPANPTQHKTCVASGPGIPASCSITMSVSAAPYGSSLWTDYAKTTVSVPPGWSMPKDNMCWVVKPDGSC